MFRGIVALFLLFGLPAGVHASFLDDLCAKFFTGSPSVAQNETHLVEKPQPYPEIAALYKGAKLNPFKDHLTRAVWFEQNKFFLLAAFEFGKSGDFEAAHAAAERGIEHLEEQKIVTDFHKMIFMRTDNSDAQLVAQYLRWALPIIFVQDALSDSVGRFFDISSPKACVRMCIRYTGILHEVLDALGLKVVRTYAPKTAHFILLHNEIIIDPTYQQFFLDPAIKGIFVGDGAALTAAVYQDRKEFFAKRWQDNTDAFMWDFFGQ